MHDCMHIIFLGIMRDVVGSIIKDLDLRQELPLAPSIEESLRLLYSQLLSWCDRNRVSKPPTAICFTVANTGIRENAYPELSTTFKASACKTLLFWIASHLNQLPQHDEHAKIRASCIWALAQFVHVTDRAGVLLSDAEAQEAHKCVSLHLRLWQDMAVRSKERNVKNFKIRPKHHYLQHLSDACLRNKVSPRIWACWADEGYLNVVKNVATKCHAKTAVLRQVQRFLLHCTAKWHLDPNQDIEAKPANPAADQQM
jgi:hypothetical protein